MLVLLLDRSASMEGKVDGLVEATNQLLASLPPTTSVRIYAFSNYVECLSKNETASSITKLVPYQVDGETALYDTLVYAIEKFTSPDTTFVVVSDGKDTCSASTLQDVQRLRHKSKGNFIYIGQGADAATEGKSLGFDTQVTGDDDFKELLTSQEVMSSLGIVSSSGSPDVNAYPVRKKQCL